MRRIDEILDNVTAIVQQPSVFADPVAASASTREEHFEGPGMHDAPSVTSGKAASALRAMRELHSKLAALSLAVSRTSFESCGVTSVELEHDEKKRVEVNTAQRVRERNRDEADKIAKEKRFRDAQVAELQKQSVAAVLEGDQSEAVRPPRGAAFTKVGGVVKAGVANAIWSKLKTQPQGEAGPSDGPEGVAGSKISLLGSMRKK